MPRLRLLPYLVPRIERVQTESWRLRVEGLDDAVQQLLHYWDPGVPLRLHSRLTVDIDGVRADCQLSQDDLLQMGVVWLSPGTTVRGRGAAIDLNPRGQQSVEVSLQIDGGDIADRLQLESQVILAASAPGHGSLAPVRAGSILWRSETTIQLEGSASRFPMEWADFGDLNALPALAGWYLDWDAEDLRRPLLGGVRLFVNRAHFRVAQAAGAIRPLPIDRPIRDAMRWDVGRTLVLGALRNQEFVANPDSFVDGTVGAVIRTLIRTSFPGDSIESLRSRIQNDVFQFECLLQDRLALFGWQES